MSQKIKTNNNHCMNKLRIAPLILTCLILQACSTATVKTKNSQPQIPASNERLMTVAENYSGLIELYKSRLSKTSDIKETDQIRQKLGDVYLSTGDPESTLFYIEPVISSGRGNAALFLQKSRALLAMDKIPEALQTGITALSFNSSDPDILNQLGLVYANLHQYVEARQYFDKARAAGIDDITSKNNLAMIDILEQHYDAAIKRLMPLYRSGQTDDQVRSNLLIALAKKGQFKTFSVVYGQANSEDERLMLYQVLSGSEARGAYGS